MYLLIELGLVSPLESSDDFYSNARHCCSTGTTFAGVQQVAGDGSFFSMASSRVNCIVHLSTFDDTFNKSLPQLFHVL